jgi:hypothetical protein
MKISSFSQLHRLSSRFGLSEKEILNDIGNQNLKVYAYIDWGYSSTKIMHPYGKNGTIRLSEYQVFKNGMNYQYQMLVRPAAIRYALANGLTGIGGSDNLIRWTQGKIVKGNKLSVANFPFCYCSKLDPEGDKEEYAIGTKDTILLKNLLIYEDDWRVYMSRKALVLKSKNYSDFEFFGKWIELSSPKRMRVVKYLHELSQETDGFIPQSKIREGAGIEGGEPITRVFVGSNLMGLLFEKDPDAGRQGGYRLNIFNHDQL